MTGTSNKNAIRTFIESHVNGVTGDALVRLVKDDAVSSIAIAYMIEGLHRKITQRAEQISDLEQQIGELFYSAGERARNGVSEPSASIDTDGQLTMAGLTTKINDCLRNLHKHRQETEGLRTELSCLQSRPSS